MGKLLFVWTFATNDPTRASMPFIVASGALDRGHEPMIVLMGEAVYLPKQGVADIVQGVGFPPLRQTLEKILDHTRICIRKAIISHFLLMLFA